MKIRHTAFPWLIFFLSCSSQISPEKNNTRQHSFLRHIFPILFLLSAAFFIGSAFVIADYKERILEWGSITSMQSKITMKCQVQCRPPGSEALPRGIVSPTADLERRSLWGEQNKKKSMTSMSLLAMAVGIRQKESVRKIVEKFPSSDFLVMLFHYDGIVDEWKDLEWSDRAIHVSAINQTKWWFAKRFLHPDIVSEYAYIFLWDEDLGVEHFNAKRYLSIIKEEGLEISQPALDPKKSTVHHRITARVSNSRVHRRTYSTIGRRRCNENSTSPLCTGFVEMMAPVFSRASWRCAWYLIQSDLPYGWGVDFQLGYCAQGDRTKNVGVVDSEYIIHYGLPTLGGSEVNKTKAELPDQAARNLTSSSSGLTARAEVLRLSLNELETFKRRWARAVKNDECWMDPFQQSPTQKS